MTAQVLVYSLDDVTEKPLCKAKRSNHVFLSHTAGKLKEKDDAALVENGNSFDNEWDTVEGGEGGPKVSHRCLVDFVLE